MLEMLHFQKVTCYSYFSKVTLLRYHYFEHLMYSFFHLNQATEPVRRI